MTLDFMLVHGYELTEEGQLDAILRDKLEHTLRLYQSGHARNIIVAGKYTKSDKEFCERTGATESSVMKQYLANKNVPLEAIFEEDEGKNTFDCTKNAFNKIILPHRWNSGIIVSNLEHLPRIILQTGKIFPTQIFCFYSGLPISDPVKREKFLEQEKEKIRYTLGRND
jgi:vancomycin permeability regulator SanA